MGSMRSHAHHLNTYKARFLPMNPYVELMRPLNAAIAAFSALVGALVIQGAYVLDEAILLPVAMGMVVTFLVTAGGNAFNDYMDAEVDRTGHPGRPLPSGRLTRPQALRFSFVCFLVAQPLAGVVVSVGISGIFPLVVELLAVDCLFVYELWLKSKGLSGNIMVGLLSALTLLFGASCAAGPMHEGMPTVAVLFALAFFASAGREVTKDIEDVEADRGARLTLPMVVSAPMALGTAGTFIAAAIMLSPLPIWPMGVMGLAYLAVVLAADAVFLYSLAILGANPRRAERVQKVGFMLALLAFLVGSLEGGIA
jgi:geranylgeranylglycerol-phosphate geranylgeranyltransferase